MVPDGILVISNSLHELLASFAFGIIISFLGTEEIVRKLLLLPDRDHT